MPLIVLPGALFLSYLFTKPSEMPKDNKEELSLSLGETQDSILDKNAAYDALFEKGDGRTMLDGLEDDNDSLAQYSDNLSDKQRRYIDSLKFVQDQNAKRGNSSGSKMYYDGQNQIKNNNDRDYKRSADIIRMLNEGASEPQKNNNSENIAYNNNKEEEIDPVKMLKKQMLMMDSLEKSRDPKFQAQYQAEQKIKKNKEKMKAFLNSSLTVKKAGMSNEFNSISNEKNDNFIKAVIDENMKGYLSSRIRFRILDDIYAGKHLIPKGSILYGQISGFTLQRVNINIVSVLSKGEILPINLTVFDNDAMKGLYIPKSTFREMMRELGTNSVQGSNLQSGSESFFTSLGSKLFTSASTTISNIIKENKAKLKYNTYIYLINEKELDQNENN